MSGTFFRRRQPSSLREDTNIGAGTEIGGHPTAYSVNLARRRRPAAAVTGYCDSPRSLPTILPTCLSEAVELVAPYGSVWRLEETPRHGQGRLKIVVEPARNLSSTRLSVGTEMAPKWHRNGTKPAQADCLWHGTAVEYQQEGTANGGEGGIRTPEPG